MLLNNLRFRASRVLYISILLMVFIYFIVYFMTNGYLPSPFFYDKYDTFMDYFNVLYWTFDDERYSVWKAIYTPFSFFLVKAISYATGSDWSNLGPFELRMYFYSNTILFLAFVVVIIFMIDFLRLKSKNKIYLFFIYLSIPFLFALERLNLILLAYLFLLLFVIFEKKVFWASLFLALAISLKIYLIALLFIPLLMYRFNVVFFTIIFFIIINELSAIAIGADDWLLFLHNLFSFNNLSSFYQWAYFSYSYRNLVGGFISKFSSYEEFLSFLDYVALFITFLFYGLVSLKFLYLPYKQKERNSGYMYLLLLMLIMIVVNNSGGYVFILLFPFILFMTNTRFQEFLLFLLVLPFGLGLGVWSFVIYTESFFSHEMLFINKDINLGMIIRPLVFIWLYISISIYFLGSSNRFVRNRNEIKKYSWC